MSGCGFSVPEHRLQPVQVLPSCYRWQQLQKHHSYHMQMAHCLEALKGLGTNKDLSRSLQSGVPKQREPLWAVAFKKSPIPHNFFPMPAWLNGVSENFLVD